MEDMLQYQKPAMKKGAYSHILTEDGKYVLLNEDGRANLLRLEKGLHSLVLEKTRLALSPTCSTHRVIAKYTNNVA
jgi:hypothetical protein